VQCRVDTQISFTKNPLGLVRWSWLRSLECAPPQVFRFDSPDANFGGLIYFLGGKEKSFTKTNTIKNFVFHN